jgi:hypothetical protein
MHSKAAISICLFVAFTVAAAIAPASRGAAAQGHETFVANPPTFSPGDTWTIRYSDGTKAKRKFLREEPGVLVFEVSETSPRRRGSHGLLHLNRDLATIKMVDTGGEEVQRFEPHSFGLRFPLTVGKEWQGRCQRFDEGRFSGTFIGAYKVVRIESVTVPAGTFQAFRVEGETYEIRDPKRRWRFNHWYAPEVRMEVRVHAMEPDGSLTGLDLSEFRWAGQVLKPARGTGPPSQVFLGIWEGYWKEMILATRLTIERIEGDIVFAIYWRGAYIFPGLQKPSQQSIEGKFVDEKTMRFEVWDDANHRWAEATYTFSGDEKLTGTWKSGGIVATALLEKEP